jgi:phage-related protein
VNAVVHLDKYLYNCIVDASKPVEWLGNSREELRKFPLDVRRTLGRELNRVQDGLMPTDFKPMPQIAQGVYEIRVHVEGAWRMLYVAKFPRAIYVLHAFQKKTQQTAAADIAIAKKRYRDIGE